MKRRQYISIVCTFLFFTIAAGLEFFFTKERNLATYEKRIEESLHEKEEAVSAFFEDADFLSRRFKTNNALQDELLKSDLDQLRLLTTEDYNICLYHRDSIIFWTNNRVFPADNFLANLPQSGFSNDLVELSNGFYESIFQSFPNVCEGCYGIALIPIKNEYRLESHYLQNRFISTNRNSIPKEVLVSPAPTNFIVNSANDKALVYLDAKSGIKDKSQLQLLLFVYFLAFISLGFVVNDFAVMLVRKYYPWVGAAFLVGVVFGLRYLTVHFGLTANFSDLQTFSETFETPVLNSTSTLGDLLINIVLLLWMMVFFHQEFQVKRFENVSFPIRYALSSLNYFSIILGILMITGVFKSLVIDSDITFDFDNVFNLNFDSFLAILGVILLLFALFLFSHRMMSTIVQIGLSKHQRLISLGIAAVVSIPVIMLSDLMLPIPQILLVSLIYIGLFDLFIDNENPNLTWLVTWLVLFAAFSSILLFKYNADRDYNLREEYARELAEFRDDTAEVGLEDMNVLLQNEMVFNQLDFNLSLDDIRNSIDKHFTDDKYLFQNYSYKIYSFSKLDSNTLITNRKDTLVNFLEKFNEAKLTARTGLRFWENEEGESTYLLKIEGESYVPTISFLEFEQKSSNTSKVYTELLLDQQYKNLQKLSNYDYAIYKNGNLVREDGRLHDKRIPLEDLPEVGVSEPLKSTSTRWELLFHGENDVMVNIGRNIGGYIKPLSLFSYLFGILLIIVIVLAFINSFTNVLPTALNFTIINRPSLRNRIQFSVITLILLSFVMIGLISVWHFSDQSVKYHEGRLDRKARAAKTSAQREVELIYKTQPDLKIIERLVGPTSKIHRLDVNLYDLGGNLISSSEKNIFYKGVVAPKMGAQAFFEFNNLDESYAIQDEAVGDLKYKSAYVPLKNTEGEKIAYMGLPYYSQNRDLRGDVTEFMGTLLNVYVFLLLIAGAIAIAVANSITRPISDLGESLKRLKIGRRNERLHWESKDELGELIAQYNLMIEELDESTNKLAKSEREGAWREMAKQVAHEIKNPLTPMKLSIQYLLHAYQSSPENIAPLMKRVSKTLIEQIDALSQIASEFSNFAKMPEAENTRFLLNDLTASVYGLFGNERDGLKVSLFMPDKQFYVYGDKKHLTRVLNNLIKNAIQAIPDNRPGEIDVSLIQKRDYVMIKVKDNGTGISDEKKDKVFVPNFTTKSSGTGLGLAISKNIIDTFKGDIYFDTEVGIGTTFFVELPILEIVEINEV